VYNLVHLDFFSLVRVFVQGKFLGLTAQITLIVQTAGIACPVSGKSQYAHASYAWPDELDELLREARMDSDQTAAHITAHRAAVEAAEAFSDDEQFFPGCRTKRVRWAE
jgi:hypothetical protein